MMNLHELVTHSQHVQSCSTADLTQLFESLPPAERQNMILSHIQQKHKQNEQHGFQKKKRKKSKKIKTDSEKKQKQKFFCVFRILQKNCVFFFLFFSLIEEQTKKVLKDIILKQSNEKTPKPKKIVNLPEYAYHCVYDFLETKQIFKIIFTSREWKQKTLKKNSKNQKIKKKITFF